MRRILIGNNYMQSFKDESCRTDFRFGGFLFIRKVRKYVICCFNIKTIDGVWNSPLEKDIQ